MHVASVTAPRLAAASKPAPPTPAPAVAAGAPDRVTIGAPAPPAPAANPWPDLEQRGLLAAAPAVPGPVGPALSDATRQGLRDAFQRLQAGGITFERQRGFRFPFLMKKYVPLSPDALETALEQEPARFKHHYNANLPGQEHVRLSSLQDLQALDIFHGLGEAAAPAARRGVVRAIRDLQASGWNVARYDYYGYGYKAADPGDAFNALGTGRQRVQVFRQSPGYGVDISRDQDLIDFNYFQGSGADQGLAHPQLARELKAAAADGLLFTRDDSYQSGDGSAGSAYAQLAGGSGTLIAHRKDEVGVAVSAADLANVKDVEQRAAAVQAIYEKTLAPAAKACDLRVQPQTLTDTALRGNSAFSPEIRAAVLAEVLRAHAGQSRDDDGLQRSAGIAARLEGLTSDPVELADLVNRYGALGRHEGVPAADAFLDTMDGGLRKRAGSPQEEAQIKDIFTAAMKATGSMYAASEAIDLVRIPIGGESDADRLKLFLAIAARESESTVDNSVRDYRAVLVHRLPGESLAAAGARMEDLLHALSVGRQQERAAEVFAAIQDGVKETRFGDRSADDVLGRFEQALVVRSGVDGALNAIRASGADGVAAGPETVQPEQGAVVIGGIRVPTRNGSH